MSDRDEVQVARWSAIKSRVGASLRELRLNDAGSTRSQARLAGELEELGYHVTQSMVSRYEQGLLDAPLTLERMVGWALCCEALSSRAFKELLSLAGFYLPWNEADLASFDELLRSYRRLSLADQVVVRATALAHPRHRGRVMTGLVPHAETTAANLARVLRLHALPSTPWEPHQRAVAARRLLEELGVRCDESAALHDLKGFLLSSPRGSELIVSRDLDDEQRLEVYAHLIAHALLGPDGPELALAARFEYVPGRAPGERPAHEVREELLADAVARAILAGRLEAAPRLIYCRDLGPGRGRFSRAVLRGIHLGSLALYRRSRRYQRLRSLPVVTAFTERVHSFLGSAA